MTLADAAVEKQSEPATPLEEAAAQVNLRPLRSDLALIFCWNC